MVWFQFTLDVRYSNKKTVLEGNLYRQAIQDSQCNTPLNHLAQSEHRSGISVRYTPRKQLVDGVVKSSKKAKVLLWGMPIMTSHSRNHLSCSKPTLLVDGESAPILGIHTTCEEKCFSKNISYQVHSTISGRLRKCSSQILSFFSLKNNIFTCNLQLQTGLELFSYADCYASDQTI